MSSSTSNNVNGGKINDFSHFFDNCPKNEEESFAQLYDQLITMFYAAVQAEFPNNNEYMERAKQNVAAGILNDPMKHIKLLNEPPEYLLFLKRYFRSNNVYNHSGWK